MTFGDRVLVDASLGTPTLGLGVRVKPNANQAGDLTCAGRAPTVWCSRYTVQRTWIRDS